MLKQQIAQLVEQSLTRAFPDHQEVIQERKIIIEYPKDATHGDYACNIALQLAKPLGMPPRQVAERLVEFMSGSDFIQTMEIAGPGFINFYVSVPYLVGNMRGILDRTDAYGTHKKGENQRILVEYSSPNTNKPLHLGHARNNFLGMAAANLLAANGYEVIKTQIINDRGIHICKSMAAYETYGRDTSPESLDKKSDHFVGDYYVKYAQNEEELKDRAVEMLQMWEASDSDVRELWAKMNEWVLSGFTQTYQAIGSHFDFVTFESDISEGGRALVEAAVDAGKAEKIEGGALAINLADAGLGDSETGYKVLVRSDGTTIYMTQDLQLAVHRMEGDSPAKHVDQLIYVVGNEQDYHFKVLFEVLKRFGYDWADQLHHLSYGMVELPSGKMKSREGTTVDMDNLLAEIESLVDAEITTRDLPYEGKQRTDLTRIIALGALKYYMLRVDAKSNMLYDPASSIDFQGNTGPYLQYTHARIRSILRKSTISAEELHNAAVDPSDLSQPEEIMLLRKLALYPETIHNALDGYRIHQIAHTLHDLAQAFNVFYSQHSVLDAPTPEIKTARLQLITAVAQVLKNGLAILGIDAPERM